MTESAKSPPQKTERLIRALFTHFGPQNWWPARSRLEVIVGAILTQNTNWRNVELAIANLRQARLLTVARLREVSRSRLQSVIRPSGFYRQKATTLKTFIRFLDANYSGSLHRMFATPTDRLRSQLLSIKGIGHETADSILLYAGSHPIFVVDAYTRRIVVRHGLHRNPRQLTYDEIRSLFEGAMSDPVAPSPSGRRHQDWRRDPRSPRHPPSPGSRLRRPALAQQYNELHAMIVRIGTQYCRKTPDCDSCPLRGQLPPRSGYLRHKG